MSLLKWFGPRINAARTGAVNVGIDGSRKKRDLAKCVFPEQQRCVPWAIVRAAAMLHSTIGRLSARQVPLEFSAGSAATRSRCTAEGTETMKSIITTLLVALMGFCGSVAWAQQPAESRSTMNEQRTIESAVAPAREARPLADAAPASRATPSPALPRSTGVQHPTPEQRSKPAALCACVDLGDHA